ncbi:serine/threonine-protein kinase [Pseudomonas aeruginosa]|uniref:serine/threonine-protein kinase n=1 Tax=Pseudomonas aeruginosa TaxID=287 RepID=UPI001067937A|nr:serine/threonine-protein kinase [Pseudomonas aeruginosa]TER26487.1 VWA domain-containing protein [Pseudomonas aeruginosa]TER38135.1 VWA domain-containing protein [Pseudomonas aeruginosa]
MDIELPGFDIERELGEGAMATVYLATQRSLQRKVALKVMAAALAADPSFAERFLREGRTLARLSHPNTVTIHDIGNVGSCYYMAMEYLPNGTLKERIQQGLDPELGLVYVRQVAAALGYAHSQGLVHRDVKPANILFRADGTAVLSDFGIAKSIEDNTQFTQVGFAVGTPSYMSPEQARGQEIDGRADLYALGVVLYEILTGKLPYNGKDSLSTALAHLTEPLPELPIEQGRYQDILRQLLAKDPAERFPTAGALIAALDRLAPSALEATQIRPLATPQGSPRASNPPPAEPAPMPPADLGGLQPVSIQLPPVTPSAGGERPLLMPGKKTLFQRVLTKPGAAISAEAGGPPRAGAVPAFSVLYVYARKQVGGSPWLRVGASSNGEGDGWLPASAVSDWKQSLVLKFTERSGRAPVMFLNSAEQVERLLGDTRAARDTLTQAVDHKGDPQVVAVEPNDRAIPQDQFYLLPIFDSKESFDADGQPAQLLEVASIDPGGSAAAPQAPGQAGQGGASGAASDTFRTGIVLVVDTSVSMQPYIDRVREVIDGLQRQIGERGDLDKVSFGLVGFRNNTDKTPGLEYVSKTLVPLQPGNDAQRFAELSSQVRATDVSSHSFNEDAFAGIMQAVDEMDWSPYAGRVVLLVTDAGALRKNDPLGRTQMNEAEVRQAALRKGVKIYALHLRTPAGKNNHGYAEQQYRSLTADANPKIADLYIPVAGGEVNAFGNTVKEIGTVFADLVHDAGNRKPQAPRFDAAPSVASKSAAIGYAMQMEFLGRRDPVRAPQVVTAWTADRDLTNPALPAFQVCVLLSKLQLNELQQSLKLIVDAAKRTQTSPKDFFQEIASASAYMSRDPAQLVKGSNLAQSGVLGEYLEGLPYRSKSLNMTQDLWLSLSVAEQQDFIDELESKIRLYETFHNDVANWVRFGDADAGDALYRVPLSTLP